MIMGAWGLGRKRLPYDAEVEYIHIPSGGWFDTGWKNFNTTDITFSMTMEVTQFNASYDTYFATFKQYALANALTLRRYGTTQRLQFYANTGIANYMMFDCPTGRTGYLVEHGVFSVNGVVNINGFANFYVDSPIIIGAASVDGVMQFATSAFKLYSVQCKDANDTLVHDFIPVRKGAVGYVYDRVTGKLFGNQGPGSFEPTNRSLA